MNITKTLIIVRGQPGSGKSTWIKNNIINKLDKTCKIAICSADHFFIQHGNGEYKFNPRLLGEAHNQCMIRVRIAMKSDYDLIVVDNTNIVTRDYQVYLELAQKHGYTPYQQVMTGSFQNVHGVPDDKVQMMKARFQEDASLQHWDKREEK